MWGQSGAVNPDTNRFIEVFSSRFFGNSTGGGILVSIKNGIFRSFSGTNVLNIT